MIAYIGIFTLRGNGSFKSSFGGLGERDPILHWDIIIIYIIVTYPNHIITKNNFLYKIKNHRTCVKQLLTIEAGGGEYGMEDDSCCMHDFISIHQSVAVHICKVTIGTTMVSRGQSQQIHQ